MKLSERIQTVQDRNQAAHPAVAPHPAVKGTTPVRTSVPPQAASAARTEQLAGTQPTAVVPSPAAPDQAPPVQAPKAQPVDVFAAMKQRAATALFERMGARFNDASVTEQELRSTAKDELIRIIDAEQVPLTPEERTRLVRDVADDVLGYGPLQRLLDDPSVTEIMVNRMDQIYVERKGKLTLTESRFSSEEHLRKVIERIVSKVGRRID